MMGAKSRDKGKRGELEVAALVRKHGFKARRGQQFSGGPGSPDVVHSIPGVHLEVKRTEKLSLYDALDQAAAESDTMAMAVVLHRRSRKRWVAILDADDFLGLIKEAGND